MIELLCTFIFIHPNTLFYFVEESMETAAPTPQGAQNGVDQNPPANEEAMEEVSDSYSGYF